MSRLEACEPGQCRVWWADPRAAGPHLAAMLDAGERERWRWFRRRSDRDLYLVTHALARVAVAATARTEPAQVRFRSVCRTCGGPHGKPRPAGVAAGLELSLSHAGDRAVVALARGAAVGVDVERIAPWLADDALLGAALTAREQRAVAALPARARPRALFAAWTRKEAVLKATGHGLAIAPTHVEVAPYGRPASLVRWTAQPALAQPVHLFDLAPGAGHIASLALLGPRLPVIERDATSALEPSHDDTFASARA